MKRLTAQVGITYFTVLTAAFYLSDLLTIALCALCLILTVVFFVIKKTRKTIFIPAMAAAALIACLVNLGYTYLVVRPVEQRYAGAEHKVTARLDEEPYKSYSLYYYRLRTTAIDDSPVNVKMLLRVGHALDMEPDDTVNFTAELSAPDTSYNRAKGYLLCADSYELEYEITPCENHTVRYRVIQLRRLMRRAFDELLPHDCSSLCRAVLLGDKYALDMSSRDDFRYAGASYFIVVSGMHFAVLSLLLMRLFKRLRPRWLVIILMAAFIVLYMAITGFQPSVVRSGIMIGITTLGVVIRRQTYAPNHLGISGIVAPMILSPYCAGDIGLTLSFYATLSILLWSDPISHKLCFKSEYGNIYGFDFMGRFDKMLHRLKDKEAREKKTDISSEDKRKLFFKKLFNAFMSLLSVSLAANILVIPITIIAFKAISVVTLFSAILLYLPICLILVLSLFVSALYLLGPLRYVAMLLSWPLFWLCRYVLWMVGKLAELPFAYIHVGYTHIYLWLLISAILGVCLIFMKNKRRYLPLAALASAIILLTGVTANTLIQLDTLRLEVYDCGEGICAGINSSGRYYIFSMSAKSRQRYQILNRLTDAYGGAGAVLCRNEQEYIRYTNYSGAEFAIDRYLLYDRVNDGMYPDDTIVFSDDSTFILDDGLVLRTAVNGSHVVPYITAGDKDILIVPGNCDIDDIPESFRSPDIAVLTEAFDGEELLSCGDLIISAERDIVDSLSGSYENVYFACDGDIRYDLR